MTDAVLFAALLNVVPDAVRATSVVGGADVTASDARAASTDGGHAAGLSAPGSLATGAGSFIEGTYRGPHGERRYKLYLPGEGESAARRPLLVMLHGCTQDADDIARGTRFNEAAESRGWMVLYPEQPPSANVRKCWNWFDPAHQRRDAGEPAIIAELTREVATRHNADPARVYLAGISAGGAMATLVAAAYPERFAALAVHSGLLHVAATNLREGLDAMARGVPAVEAHATSAFQAMGEHRRVMPTLVLQGEGDAVVAPINGAQLARQWFLTNALVIGQPLDTTSGATDEQFTGDGDYRVRSANYRAKDGRVLSTLVTVKTLGHAWSGGDPAGSFTDPRAPKATERIIQFFAGHSLP